MYICNISVYFPHLLSEIKDTHRVCLCLGKARSTYLHESLRFAFLASQLRSWAGESCLELWSILPFPLHCLLPKDNYFCPASWVQKQNAWLCCSKMGKKGDICQKMALIRFFFIFPGGCYHIGICGQASSPYGFITSAIHLSCFLFLHIFVFLSNTFPHSHIHLVCCLFPSMEWKLLKAEISFVQCYIPISRILPGK